MSMFKTAINWLKQEIKKRNKLFALINVLRNPYSFIYGYIISLKIDQPKFMRKVIFSSNVIPMKITKSPTARFIVHGNLIIEPFLGRVTPITISLGENATLEILGDFVIGQGVDIVVCDNAHLKIGGRHNASGSGITADCRIMVKEYIEIGKDVLIAWDIVITDSDWHEIKGQEMSKPVYIHNNVWLAHGVSVLKGVTIAAGSIIAAKSVVTHSIPEKVLAAGIPAKPIKNDIAWER